MERMLSALLSTAMYHAQMNQLNYVGAVQSTEFIPWEMCLANLKVHALRTNLRLLFSHFESSLLPLISFLSLNCLPYFQKLPYAFFHIFIFIGSHLGVKRESEKRSLNSLDLFRCVYKVFINNYPDGCIPQLDAGSLTNWNKKSFGDT